MLKKIIVPRPRVMSSRTDLPIDLADAELLRKAAASIEKHSSELELSYDTTRMTQKLLTDAAEALEQHHRTQGERRP